MNGCICITGQDHDETEMDMTPEELAAHRAEKNKK